MKLLVDEEVQAIRNVRGIKEKAIAPTFERDLRYYESIEYKKWSKCEKKKKKK